VSYSHLRLSGSLGKVGAASARAVISASPKTSSLRAVLKVDLRRMAVP
jgi:hypothetical protein